jgi:hypothetical protein
MQRIKQNPFLFILFVLIMMAMCSCERSEDIVLENCSVLMGDVIVHDPTPSTLGRSADGGTNDIEIRSFDFIQTGEGQIEVSFSSVNEDIGTRYRILFYDLNTQNFFFNEYYRSAGQYDGMNYTYTINNVPEEKRIIIYLYTIKQNKQKYEGGMFMYLNPAA